MIPRNKWESGKIQVERPSMCHWWALNAQSQWGNHKLRFGPVSMQDCGIPRQLPRATVWGAPSEPWYLSVCGQGSSVGPRKLQTEKMYPYPSLCISCFSPPIALIVFPWENVSWSYCTVGTTSAEAAEGATQGLLLLEARWPFPTVPLPQLHNCFGEFHSLRGIPVLFLLVGTLITWVDRSNLWASYFNKFKGC